MRKLLLSVMLITAKIAFGQPNLIVSQITSIPNMPLNKGFDLTFRFKVKNIGNSTAGLSHSKVYLTPTTNINDGIVLSDISTEILSANQETQTIEFTHPIPYSAYTGRNYIVISVDSRNEVVESNEENSFGSSSLVTITNFTQYKQNLPYPLIFIHGLASEYLVWDDLKSTLQDTFGWSYGGNLNFCLNQDANTATSNFISDYRDWTDNNSIGIADFYLVNFSVDINGAYLPANNSVKSNQSAITKQGYAIRDAIKNVMLKTGKDKVVLVGHSMGGLASRQYLQNSSMWQPDGMHHVAKLLTIGTPHGGSNSTSFGVLFTIDELSEAVRDLRYSYISQSPGAYLFGGNENTTNITGFVSNFSNVDVNCNGIIGEDITGLNQKNLPPFIDYSCIIGTGNFLGGDGVVDADRANLNTYYPTIGADTFICRQPIGNFYFSWHTQLPKQSAVILKGLDEPKEIYRAYGIEKDELYYSNITTQSIGAPYIIDYDDYSFSVPSDGVVNIKTYNIPVNSFYVRIYNSNGTPIFLINSNGKGYLNNDVSLTAGNYFLEIFGIPDTDSWRYPYAFKLTFNSVLPVYLISFNAANINNQGFLSWRVERETNFREYQIEKSTSQNQWNHIGTVSASNQGSYSFIDLNASVGQNFYRIKMVDNDGAIQYSQVRDVKINLKELIKISPNPTSNYAIINSQSAVIKNIIVYNLQGQKVPSFIERQSSSAFKLNCENLINGVYIISVELNSGQRVNDKLIISK